ncbi:MAG: CPBP family intramembrane metalloprotease [Elusimicrobia bacterium]|nr:CPBP family intramembrane metalloprotease [Elusimicrobiota bacterium]MDE2237231.1 CPBP family intramembrane metalloprotease [Elusimicrobiota bacterium]MDE2425212.1 CPBP family intramembrane metalloprotease [Elusimicrobiota bacterium]
MKPALREPGSPAAERRALEAAIVCLAIPVGAAVLHWRTGLPLMPLKLVVLAAALALLWRDPSFDRRSLLRLEAVKSGWRGVLRRFLALAGILCLAFWLLAPAAPFAFARRHPARWLAFALFSPVLPAYPEEFLFRVFFFQRYGGLFKNPRARVAASALTFSLAHLYLANAWAVGLAFLGGLLFASTYERSHSAALTSLEHGLWAAAIFLIGLGPFFVPGLR